MIVFTPRSLASVSMKVYDTALPVTLRGLPLSSSPTSCSEPAVLQLLQLPTKCPPVAMPAGSEMSPYVCTANITHNTTRYT
jgi:hypothetical protein